MLIDFNGISHDTPEQLKAGLNSRLDQIGQRHGIQLDESMMVERFTELIHSLRRETVMPVVILVDEYDKPLIDHLGKGEQAMEIAKANRDILKYFFGVIKDGDVAESLRFVFFTGVSKFSRVSIFSELNNLNDITTNRHYAEMLGYTQEELETCFEFHIRRFATETELTSEGVIEGLRDHYNGYRFSEKDVRVYNPFSVLSALDEMAFKHYWFETGTPTFLVNLLRERNYPLPMIENLQSDQTMFSTYDLDNLKPEAILFQTGYITIKDVEDQIFCFDYPNLEVKTAFLKHLLDSFIEAKTTFDHLKREALGINLPPSSPRKEQTGRGLLPHPDGLGADGSEVLGYRPSNGGVPGQGLHQNSRAPGNSDKGYADPRKGKKIIFMGINFDSKKAGVGGDP